MQSLEAREVPATLLGVTSQNHLVSFKSSAPNVLLADTPISGLQVNETIVGMDSRPATGVMYAMGLVDDGATRTGRLYTLNAATGVATMVGSAPFSTTLSDTSSFGFDFHPNQDYICITSGNDENLGLSIAAVLTYTGTPLDEPNGAESVSAIAFAQPFGGDTSNLFGYNFITDDLVRMGPVNGGGVSITGGKVSTIAHATLNGAGFVSSNLTNFDIGGNFGDPELAFLSTKQVNLQRLFTIDLESAALVDLGLVGDGSMTLSAFAVSSEAPAPTISLGGKMATWTDPDGDVVTMRITKGTLTPQMFRMLPASKGSVLSRVELLGNFDGTNITITAKPGPNGGDGLATVGLIDATGVDLGVVTVVGDLQAIRAGNPANPARAIAALNVGSFGQLGHSAVPTDQGGYSSINGGIGTLNVARDFSGRVNITNGSSGTLRIGGSIRGNDQTFGVYLRSDKPVGSLTIGRDVVGGSGFGSGYVILDDKVGLLKIGGSLVGGFNGTGGDVHTKAVITCLIGGSIVNTGLTLDSAAVCKIGGSVHNGYVSIGGSNLIFNLGGSIVGTTESAYVNLHATKATATIGGSIVGGSVSNSGVFSTNGATTLTVKGDLHGGSANGAGTISTTYSEGFTNLTIRGSVVSGDKSAIISGNAKLGNVTINGGLIGTPDAPVKIIARGTMNPASEAAALAIGKVIVGGDTFHAIIAAGVDKDLVAVTPDVSIGLVRIAGDCVATSIAAGVDPQNGAFGDADGFGGGNGLVSKIGSITIGGQLLGTAGGALDYFGIMAEKIGSFKVHGLPLSFTAGVDDFNVGPTSDVRVRDMS